MNMRQTTRNRLIQALLGLLTYMLVPNQCVSQIDSLAFKKPRLYLGVVGGVHAIAGFPMLYDIGASLSRTNKRHEWQASLSYLYGPKRFHHLDSDAQFSLYMIKEDDHLISAKLAYRLHFGKMHIGLGSAILYEVAYSYYYARVEYPYQQVNTRKRPVDRGFSGPSDGNLHVMSYLMIGRTWRSRPKWNIESNFRFHYTNNTRQSIRNSEWGISIFSSYNFKL
jgi:hypothetical protein